MRHGRSYRAKGGGSAIYARWASMHDRCRRTTSPAYPLYGGRGIRVCERWNDFLNFEADMGAPPSPGHTIDRVDNDGNYEPGNCRWATRREQARNRRSSALVTFDGQTRTIAEWCDVTGLPDDALRERLGRLGWSVERALTTPLRVTARTRLAATERPEVVR